MACVEYMSIIERAKELNALVVANEHRYFGISQPYGLNYTQYPTWDPTLMKPLTFDNTLRDGISLISWIKSTKYPYTKDSKVIMLNWQRFVRL